MDEASALIAVAEIAVAVAGFSGVATALGQRTDETFWSAGQRARFFDLLVHSGIALFASLIPLVMMYRVGPDWDWLWSSVIWAFFACIGITLGFLRGRSLPRPSGLERFVTPFVLVSFSGLMILQIYNALAMRAFWPYLAALVGNLGFAFIQFMRLIVPRVAGSEGDED
jgi:hypothetical protein